MSITDFFRKVANDYKEANRPENVKAKLQSQIEIEKLRMERDKIENERRKAKQQSWSIGGLECRKE